MPDLPKTIGLTGGIGTGKTTVARMLEELGAHVIHADTVGHRVYEPGTPGWQQVVSAFSRDILAADGRIDRKKLGQIVFADRSALEQLNAIVHPLIRDEVRRGIDAQRASGFRRPIVVEAAILIEAGWNSIVDMVWVVTAPIDEVVRRISAERGLSVDDVRARLAAQIEEAERRRFADVIIENTGSTAELRRQVEAAWAALTGNTGHPS
jgi:dephospho-CoA kinase